MYANEFLNEKNTDPENPQSPATSPTLTKRITTLLRWCGVLLILYSAVSFMLEGNQNLSPALRYWIGLILTLALCGGGMICAYALKETKGARIFFGLGTAFVSVQISQVSAMIYGYWHGDNAMQPEYEWLQFMNISPLLITIDLVITIIVATAVSYACYGILARNFLKNMLLISAIGNLFLLFPVRDPDLIALLLITLYLIIRKNELKMIQHSQMRLMEGLAARALINLPLWIILGRSLFHDLSEILTLAILSIVVISCINDAKRFTQSGPIIYVAQWLGTISALVMWLIIINNSSFFYGNSDELISFGAILFLLSFFIQYHAQLYRNMGAILALIGSYIAMMNGLAMAPIMSIGIGIILTIASYQRKEIIPMLSGNAAVLLGFWFLMEYAITRFAFASWIGAIGLGLAIIILASYMDRQETKIIAKSKNCLNELKSWI